jgi:hypothetical protein
VSHHILAVDLRLLAIIHHDIVHDLSMANFMPRLAFGVPTKVGLLSQFFRLQKTTDRSANMSLNRQDFLRFPLTVFRDLNAKNSPTLEGSRELILVERLNPLQLSFRHQVRLGRRSAN